MADERDYQGELWEATRDEQRMEQIAELISRVRTLDKSAHSKRMQEVILQLGVLSGAISQERHRRMLALEKHIGGGLVNG